MPFRRRVGRPTLVALAVANLVVVASLVAACGGSTNSGGTTTTKPSRNAMAPDAFYGAATKVNAPTVVVNATDNDFQPRNLVVKAGTTITFKATGHNQHDVVPDDPKAFDFTVLPEKLPVGGEATFRFNKPGRYYYYCSLHATPTHGDMRAVITVER
ncbi:MAG: cupredoxin domain-containing protein [Microthrixaceae bacterium]